jgi:hypothetical protein
MAATSGGTTGNATADLALGRRLSAKGERLTHADMKEFEK